MPNWCVNRLTIRGPKKDREEFIRKGYTTQWPDEEEPKPIEQCEVDEMAAKIADALTREKPLTILSFSAFIAPPKGFGNEWCTSNWGTKWDAYEVHLDTNDRRTVYDFETAWSPPHGALGAMTKQFPTLTFDLKYWERGLGFKGTTRVKNEEVLVNEYSNSYYGGKGG